MIHKESPRNRDFFDHPGIDIRGAFPGKGKGEYSSRQMTHAGNE
jgi:hypothetical protein